MKDLAHSLCLFGFIALLYSLLNVASSVLPRVLGLQGSLPPRPCGTHPLPAVCLVEVRDACGTARSQESSWCTES